MLQPRMQSILSADAYVDQGSDDKTLRVKPQHHFVFQSSFSKPLYRHGSKNASEISCSSASCDIVDLFDSWKS